MAPVDDETKDKIQEKLIEIFENRFEDVSKLLVFLSSQDAVHTDPNNPSPFWKLLLKIYRTGNRDLLKETAETMLQDLCSGMDSNKIHNIIRDMNEGMPEHNTECGNDGNQNQPTLNENKKNSTGKNKQVMVSNKRAGKIIGGAGAVGVAAVEAVNALPLSAKLTLLRKVVEAGRACGFYRVESMVATLSKNNRIVPVGLATVCLSIEVLINMCRWWRGKISGKRCAKNVLEGIFSGAAGVAGGVAGASIGTMCFPGIGSVIGGIVGGVACTMIVQKCSAEFMLYIFGIPKSEALENAFIFLDVKPNASNGEINSAYRKLCHKHHPDNDGNVNDFTLLQVHMTTIKLARGEKFAKDE